MSLDKETELFKLTRQNFDPNLYETFKKFADKYLCDKMLETAKRGDTSIYFNPNDINFKTHINAPLVMHFTKKWIKDEIGKNFKIDYVYAWNQGLNLLYRFIEIDWTNAVFNE